MIIFDHFSPERLGLRLAGASEALSDHRAGDPGPQIDRPIRAAEGLKIFINENFKSFENFGG